VVNQNPTHQRRRQSEELSPVFPTDVLLIDESQVRLMNEHGRFQREKMRLPSQQVFGQTTQFAVDHRHESIKRSLIALAPAEKHLCNAFSHSVAAIPGRIEKIIQIGCLNQQQTGKSLSNALWLSNFFQLTHRALSGAHSSKVSSR
jgi:hypothetical protein